MNDSRNWPVFRYTGGEGSEETTNEEEGNSEETTEETTDEEEETTNEQGQEEEQETTEDESSDSGEEAEPTDTGDEAPEAEEGGIGAIFSMLIEAILSIFGLGGDDDDADYTPAGEDIETTLTEVEDLLNDLFTAPVDDSESMQASVEDEEEEVMMI